MSTDTGLLTPLESISFIEGVRLPGDGSSAVLFLCPVRSQAQALLRIYLDTAASRVILTSLRTPAEVYVPLTNVKDYTLAPPPAAVVAPDPAQPKPKPRKPVKSATA